MEWTKEQLQAIETKNCKLLVSAGAGSGKTTVLVQRIINKVINDKIDIDKLLIVTFTTSAASEMRQRIAEALYDNLDVHPELNKQILLLNKASIMTIDAFCNKVVKDNFFSINIDPNFKVADSTEIELLKIETLDELLENLYDEDGSIIEMFSSNKSDENFRNLILSIHRFIQTNPYPEKWLRDKSELFNLSEKEDFGKTMWGRFLIKYSRDKIAECIEELETTAESLYENEDAKNYLLTLQDDILQLKAIRLNNTSWDDFYEDISSIKFISLKRAPKLDKDVAEDIKEIRNKVKGIIQDTIQDKIFITNSENIFSDIDFLYSIIKKISDIVIRFNNDFISKKREKNLIDFSDMEHLCLELLVNNESICEMYKNKYEEILIDEYQDSNLIQEYILNLISHGNIFMVGDVKQSIYKFRQARPELFLEKYNSYTLIDGNASDENKILLFDNFRSNETIIDQCNFIFKHIMSKEIGDLDYTKDEYLKFGAKYYPNKGDNIELHLIEKRNNEEEIIDEDIDDIEDKAQLEARVVAKRIKDLVGNFEVYDKSKKQMRKAGYGDVAILFRSTKGYIDGFLNELSMYDIPVYADINSGYFDNMEVQIVLALLKIIDNPYQDIPLVAVLRSKIGDFNPNELTDIRIVDTKCSYYEAMQKSAGQGNKKALDFLDKLTKWREKSKHLQLGELLWYLYKETNYYDYISVMPNGNIRKSNLDALLDKAERFDNSSYKGLFNFINFIENIKDSTGDFSSSKSSGELDSVVKIMSIHKSKGLEFPIVFLCGTSRKFNKMDERNQIILHQDYGFGTNVVKTDKRITYESVPKIALKLINRQEMLSEEMRILYVAFTRAREKLIITCLDNNIEKKVDKWSHKQTQYSISNGVNFADWICGTALSNICDWKIFKWDYNDVLKIRFENTQDKYKSFINNISENFKLSDVYNEIDKSFSWKYPYYSSTILPSKITVTELKRLGDESEIEDASNLELVDSPSYMSEQSNIGGTKFGTLLHNVMQRIDFNNYNIESVLSSIDECYRNKIESYLVSFKNTNLYKEIVNADCIYREMPFNLSLKLKDVFNDKVNEDNNDDVLIQGVIDLYFIKDNKITLVDYKSDNLNSENEFVEKYKTQLDYYKKALEVLTGKVVKKVVIYSFHLNKEIII